ncbi:MAG: secretin and TonB N-terminal domain-containing protein [Candidatus Omnitrophica bacterium]|nr:secretin and TonB N-terminal domain-containing protein [Candidatus Omnitrophota bacterium]MBU1128971.1 secretin and TonB N-terminal domain-containing protein [Candidatus Omnitrophota bacterium]MBU1657077.1 secretin and TonB N-terminal domain-containing protein [Candidatus Omnitrophota bacterium]MBU1784694.1 secretin and TonB N-terminal domain-containing protein [Candidatus Omnitrophota bacterium]MBU1850944.1 secretin and TonB N-terminal domain-containing protein [Candidatus Omnitrophota bact
MIIHKMFRIKAVIILFAVFFGTFSLGGYSHGQGNIPAAGDVTQVSLPDAGNITVNFKDVDILTVLNYLSEISGVDIIPSPGVEGAVTMRLRNKPWEVALDIITRNYGYAYSMEENIIRVMPKGMLQTEDTVTEVIPLNHVIREIELSQESDSTLGEEVNVVKESEAIEQVMAAVNAIIDSGRGESATFISSVNAIVVTAIPAKINEIKKMLQVVDKKPAQVLLEAKVIEISLTDAEKLGIDWNAIISASGAIRPTTLPFTNEGILKFLPGNQRDYFPITTSETPTSIADPITGVITTNTVVTQRASTMPFASTEGGIKTLAEPILGTLFSYGTLDFSQFTAVLNMIDQRKDVNILSTPRITTLNNQKATIKVVKKIMLQKTAEALQTAEAITVEFESDSEAREIGVSLTVIPHVNDSGDIVVNLIPRVSSNLEFTQLAVSTTDENTVAMSYETREANTQVRIRSNETIFIGGLVKDKVTNVVNKFPVLGDIFDGIPFLEKMFKYEGEQIDKTEIVFFVTVHLIEDGMDSIQKSYTVAEYQKYQVNYNLRQEAKKAVREEKKKWKRKAWFDFTDVEDGKKETIFDEEKRREAEGEPVEEDLSDSYNPWFYRKQR